MAFLSRSVSPRPGGVFAPQEEAPATSTWLERARTLWAVLADHHERILIGGAVVAALAAGGAYCFSPQSPAGLRDFVVRHTGLTWPAAQSPTSVDLNSALDAQYPELAQGAPPPVTFKFQPVSAQEAATWNASIPITAGPTPPAEAFLISERDPAYQPALDCLTAAIYYEAGFESVQGERAVAQVVLNRVRHAAFPKTVCGVVFQGSERKTGCQFTFACDGSMAKPPARAAWDRARGVAVAALGGYIEPSVGLATHYHTIWVVPYWSATVAKVNTLGAHVFYRWAGVWGTPPAFKGTYADSEFVNPQFAKLLATWNPPLQLAMAQTLTPVASDVPPPLLAASTPQPTEKANMVVGLESVSAVPAIEPEPVQTKVVSNPLAVPIRARASRQPVPGTW